MIDLDNYKRAIQWLRRGMEEQARQPDNKMLCDGLAHSAEVNYNVTETILRQALSELSNDASLAQLSSLELMRYAVDEGISLASGEAWLHYGIALEQCNNTQGEAFQQTLLPLLPSFIHDLESFSKRLEKKLVPVV